VNAIEVILLVIVMAAIAVVFYLVAIWLFDLFAQGREQ